MKFQFIVAVLPVNICATAYSAAQSAIGPREFVLSDISNEPDREESVTQPFSAPTAANSALM